VLGGDGNLGRLDLSELVEHFVELLAGDILLEFPDENVLLGEVCSVGTREVLVVGQGSAGLVSNLEILEFLTDLLVLLLVFNLDHGGVEVSDRVSSELGSLGELVASEFLDDFRNKDTGGGLLGELVEVENVFVGRHLVLDKNFNY
jgi:hypothetical protein